ncbi:DUF6603 domain-containing protein [Streptomyces sp. NRRL S-646]|uniref:DUF6603 domain-containing protein n=1 Tax=Streptomyces sp. NRRL S-646 TaxID=1463917 RepID=UPI00068B2618|nr:DUF6603 domain-containing protein [Streptomyces sp. NRRL S-646]
MAKQAGTLGSVALALAGLVQPVQGRFGPGGPRLFATELGLKFPPSLDTTPAMVEASGRADQQLRAIPGLAAELAGALDSGSEAAILDKSVRLAAAVKLAVDAVGAVGAAFKSVPSGSGIPPDEVNKFADAFSARVLDYLLVGAAEARTGIAEALEFVGGIERTAVAAGDAAHPAFVRRRVHVDKIAAFIANPGEQLKGLYGWGAPGFTGVVLLLTMARILRGLDIPVIEDSSGSSPLLDVVFVEVVPRSDVSPSGLAYKVVHPLAPFTLTEYDGGDWKAAFQLQLPLPLGTEVLHQADDHFTLTPPSGERIEGELAMVVTATGPGGAPYLLIGQPGGSRLEAARLAAKLGLRLGWDPAAGHATGAVVFGGEVTGLRLLIDASQGDGFVSTVLGGGKLDATFDLAFAMDSQHGLQLSGSGGLEVQVPVHVELGPVEIQQIYLAARIGGGSVPVELSAGFSAWLGPVKASVDRMGVVVDVSVPDGGGNVGPLNLDFAFKPPNGVGLAIDAGVISGGGYLYVDTDRGEYAGALELEFAHFLALKAIGLISTRMPDGSQGFSLLVVITAEFGGGGIQLGYGFTLLAVGGLIGLNRAMNLQALTEGVRTGRIDSVMFPHDVVANAPRIISDLRAYFPPEQGKFLIGPMAKIGWGTPTLVSVSLGVIIEIPGNLAVLGVLTCVLPTEELALLVLQVQFIGAIEFDKSRLWFYAQLFDSRILTMTIDGGMGLLVAWGDNPDLVLTVGGFHPSFKPPALPFPVPKRLSVDIINMPGRLIRVSGYFAVTSNTVQFGAHAELRLGFDDFGIEGQLSFDALFRFSPFAFVISISASVSLKAFGVGLFGIDLRFELEGVSPWRAHGRGSISLLFFEISADFDITWGEERTTTLPPVEVLALLAGEILKTEGWETRLPSGGTHPLVTLRQLADTDRLVLHPLGTLFVRQRSIPLGVRVDRVGAQRPSDGKRFTVSPDPTGGLVQLSVTGDKFAMAQFQDMDDAAKLSKAPYENQDAGLELSAAKEALASVRAVRRSARYELHIIDSRTPGTAPATLAAVQEASPPPTTPKRFQNVSPALFNRLLEGSSTSRSPLSRTDAERRQPFAPEDTVRVTGQRFAVAYVRNNLQAFPPTADVAQGGTSFRSETTAADALDGWVVADPSLAGKLHVIPESEVAAPLTAPGTWSPETPAPAETTETDAVRLAGGIVLVAAGRDRAGTAVATAALFDPVRKTWKAAKSLLAGRRRHSVTLLADGRVLVAGGRGTEGAVLASAEVYDPVADAWTALAPMATARAAHSATLLSTGKILVAGGIGVHGRSLSSAELFDPKTGKWEATKQPMSDARAGHQAVALRDSGRHVLVVGGELATGGDAAALAFCELYDPVAGAWAPAASLGTARKGHRATLLPDGSVLVTGGDAPGLPVAGRFGLGSLDSVERYDPNANTWTAVASLPGGNRSGHQAVLLRTGKVLVTGGAAGPSFAAGFRAATLYDPAARTWTATGGLATGRRDFTALELADGRVLAVGGLVRTGAPAPDGTDVLTATTEMYTP